MSDPLKKLMGGDTPSGGVFYLHGDDEFRKGLTARALVDAHLDPATADFNHDRLRAPDTDLDTLASIIATPPMMAEWRVIQVSETEAYAGSSKVRTLLLETAASPPPGMVLIMLGTKPSGSKAKFYSQLEKAARSLEFRPLAPDDVPGWLMERARTELGTEMEEDAARALGQAVGTDLGVLAQEVEKLAGFVREGASITRADVEAAGTRLPVVDRWGWFDDVGEKRLERALANLGVLLGQSGETGVGLTIALTTHLLRVGMAVEGGEGALANVLMRHQQWLAKGIARQAKKWSSGEIGAAIDGLRRLDRMLKSAKLSDQALIEEWLLGLLARAAA